MFLFHGLLPTLLYAQSITIDGSLQKFTENSASAGFQELSGQNITINHEMGVVKNSNLFHSFGRFNVPDNGRVTFTGPHSIANILSRVTGAEASYIGGALISKINGANLFLMNPNGIIFGEQSSINVSGAFYATTADFIELGEKEFFYADIAKDSVLNAAAPRAFGFLGKNPVTLASAQTAAIFVSGLDVTSQSDIALINRDTMIESESVDGIAIREGTFRSSNGTVNIVSMGREQSTNTKHLSVLIDSLTIERTNFDETTVSDISPRGTVTLTNGGQIDTSGKSGGTLTIRSGRLTIDGERSGLFANVVGSSDGPPNQSVIGDGIHIHVTEDIVMSNGAALQTNLSGNNEESVSSGGIHLTADHLEMSSQAFIESSVGMGSTGNKSGDISITMNTAQLQHADPRLGTIRANTEGEASGASINIRVHDHLEMSDGAFVLTGAFSGSGDAGDLDVHAGSVRLTGNPNPSVFEPIGFFSQSNPDGLLPSPTTGHPGDIRLVANQLDMSYAFISTTSANLRDAGNIEISILDGDMSVSGMGIFSEGHGHGNGGDIFVNIPQGTLVLNALGKLSSRMFGFGTAGDILIAAKGLEISEFATISTDSANFGGTGNIILAIDGDISLNNMARIFSITLGPKPGGKIDVVAQNMNMDNGSQLVSSTFSNAKAGDIYLKFSGNLKLGGGSAIASQSFSFGNNSSPERITGDAGNIEITAQDVIIRGLNNLLSVQEQSKISTDTLTAGQGGDVKINATNLFLTDKSLISSITRLDHEKAGNAGNINLDLSQDLQVDNGAQVTATSEGFRNSGSINVEADRVTLSGMNPIPFEFTPGTLTPARSAVTTRSKGVIGEAGRIDVLAREVRVLDGATVDSQSSGGDAGEINLKAGDSIFLQDGIIQTVASQADGGDIKLTASDTIQLNDSLISSSVSGGVGGNINLDPEFILLNNTNILAQAGAGQGGQIQLTANVVLADPFSNISASAGPAGIDGSVSVNAPIQNLSESIVPLPEDLVAIAQFYASRCFAQKGGKLSSFVYHQVPSLPMQPGDFMNSQFALGDFPNNSIFSGKPLLPIAKSGADESPHNFNSQMQRFSSLGFSPVIQGC